MFLVSFLARSRCLCLIEWVFYLAPLLYIPKRVCSVYYQVQTVSLLL